MPPLPEAPVARLEGALVDGARLRPYEDVRFSMGRAGKDGPLELGERIEVAAYQRTSLAATRIDGRDVWVRSFATYRAGDDGAPVAHGEIVLDRRSLLPVQSRVTARGATTELTYDWAEGELKKLVDGEPAGVFPLEQRALEAAAHESWVAAIDWARYERARLPTVLGDTGGWWAVPRLVGSEPIDLGDGVARDAWVVAMDWWSMPPSEPDHTPGAGANGTAGTGGMYWVLRVPVDGLPRVVRIRTEVTETVDQVSQIQGGVG